MSTKTSYKIVPGREVGYFDGFVIRYWDVEKQLWFDHGDKHDTRAEAEARLAELEDEEALELANSHRRLRLPDHHPWVPPTGRMATRRFTLNHDNARRALLAIVSVAFALDLAGHGAASRGWARFAYVVVAIVVVQVSIRLALRRRG